MIQTCSACSGRRCTTCHNCAGSGSAKCSACSGRGMVGYSDNASTCTACGGQGGNMCHMCQGGLVMCTRCYGNGTIDVPDSSDAGPYSPNAWGSAPAGVPASTSSTQPAPATISAPKPLHTSPQTDYWHIPPPPKMEAIGPAPQVPDSLREAYMAIAKKQRGEALTDSERLALEKHDKLYGLPAGLGGAEKTQTTQGKGASFGIAFHKVHPVRIVLLVALLVVLLGSLFF